MIDFLRQWNFTKVSILLVLTVIAGFLSALPGIMGWVAEIPALYMPLTDYLLQIWKIIVPFSVLFFSSGIIAGDIKNHWIRSILIHRITRQDLLLSKIIATLVSVIITMMLLGALPVIVFATGIGVKLDFNILNFVQVLMYFIFEAILFITIATWLSCFLNGFMNIFVLAFWMFLDNILMKGVLSLWMSNSFAGSVIIDVFFPSGFSEAAIVASTSGIFPYESLLWGFASLSFFLGIAIFSFSKINIDKSSD